jgi:autotransporter-associated beta strand protein/T5SS/PEP-CTERM-associated repeat protein
VGTNTGSNGTVNVSGGTWTNNGSLYIGNSGTGVLNLSNGTVTSNSSVVGLYASSNGTVNVSGGSWVNTLGLTVGSLGTGNLTLSGTGSVSSATTTLGASLIGIGTLNLNGGTLTTGQVSKGGGSGTVTFNGGTLQLSGNQTNLFLGFNPGNVTLAAGGGTIDTQNFNVATAYALSGPGGLTKTGTGTLTLTGNNTYTGGTTINGGTLQIGNGGTSGFVQGNINLNNSTLTFNRSGNVTFNGTISGSGQLTKTGNGTLTLSGNNNFTGTVNINSGTLLLGSSNVIANTATNMSLNGGTFATGGNSDTLGTLTLTANSTIDLGIGSSVLHFEDSSSVPWTSNTTLSIKNWSGSLTGNGTDQIYFGTDSNGLNTSQLSQIIFVNPVGLAPGNYTAVILSTGEIVPVPEPGVIAAAALLMTWLGWRERRRWQDVKRWWNRRNLIAPTGAR